MIGKEQTLSHIRAECERALEQVRAIDEDGLHIYAAQANEEMREVTTEYRATLTQIVKLVDKLASWLEREQSEESVSSEKLSCDHDTPP